MMKGKSNDKTNRKRRIIFRTKSDPATIQDKSIVTDLVDTLKANLDGCVGLAANMIGFKREF